MAIYNNPIIKGFNPDPSICFDKEYFYLVTSSFEFFPGVPVYKSRNLVNWELVGHCMADEAVFDLYGTPCSGGIYAPTIRFHNGIYYMITTNVSGKGHFIVHTTDPCGKWSEPVYVDQRGIDPSLLFDGDKVYLTSTDSDNGVPCISMCEVDPLTGKALTKRRIISYGDGGKCPEAPHLYKIGEFYYLMLAEGGTEYGHRVTVFRSRRPYGPFESCPHNPVLTHRDDYTSGIQCTGHADLTRDANGNWWLVTLGIRPAFALLHNLGRETFLAPVKWEDGWPLVGDSGRLALNMQGDLPDQPDEVNNDFYDDFSTQKTKLQWTYIRRPEFKNYNVANKAAVLTGDDVTLDNDKESPTFMGIRQTEFVSHTKVRLEIPETDTKAGLTAYYNSYYYYALTVEKNKDGVFAGLEKHIHENKIDCKKIKIPDTPELILHMYSDREFYYFYVETASGVYYIGKGSVAGLCTEGTMMMTFTGVFSGLFTEYGKALFRGFEYKENETAPEAFS